MRSAAVPKIEWRRTDVAVIDGALTPEMLAYLCEVAEGAVFDRQPLGRAVLRDRDRSVADDPLIADMLWRVLAPLMAPVPSWFGSAGRSKLNPPADK